MAEPTCPPLSLGSRPPQRRRRRRDARPCRGRLGACRAETRGRGIRGLEGLLVRTLSAGSSSRLTAMLTSGRLFLRVAYGAARRDLEREEARAGEGAYPLASSSMRLSDPSRSLS